MTTYWLTHAAVHPYNIKIKLVLMVINNYSVIYTTQWYVKDKIINPSY